eukprot:COSAG01_NODE_335_length_18690_cov_7.693185_11_plen_234_part_00
MSAPHHMRQCVSARPSLHGRCTVLCLCSCWARRGGQRLRCCYAVWLHDAAAACAGWAAHPPIMHVRLIVSMASPSRGPPPSTQHAAAAAGRPRRAARAARGSWLTEVGLSAHVLPCVFTVPTSASALPAAYHASRLQVAAGQPRFGVLPAGLVSVSPELVRDTQHANDDHPSACPQPQPCCPELCHPRSHKPRCYLSLILGRVACPSTKIWMRCVRRAPRARLRRNYAGLSTS